MEALAPFRARRFQTPGGRSRTAALSRFADENRERGGFDIKLEVFI